MRRFGVILLALAGFAVVAVAARRVAFRMELRRQAAGDPDHSITVGTLTRHYLVHVPEPYTLTVLPIETDSSSPIPIASIGTGTTAANSRLPTT